MERTCRRWLAGMLLAAAWAPATPAEPADREEAASGTPEAPAEEEADAEGRDRSLTPEEYSLNGVPPVGRAWSSTEVSQATRALLEIGGVDPERLPRAGSEISGDVFARLVDRAALAPLRDEARPVNVRAAECTLLLGAWGQLFEAYGDTPRVSHGTERTELMAAALFGAPLCLGLLERFTETLAPDDPLLPERSQGIEEIRRSIRDFVIGAVDWLRAPQIYDPADRLRLARVLETTLPEIVPHLPETTQSRLGRELRAASLEESEPEVRAAIDRAIASSEGPRR